MDTELEAFKSGIDLRRYAASHGYAWDRRESWKGSAAMRHAGTDDKIIIKRVGDGHYVYCSVRDDANNGSIIDFIEHRRRLSLRQVRKELQPWISQDRAAALLHSPRFGSRMKTDARGNIKAP